MSIQFTQYLRPNGAKRLVEINRSAEIETKADKIIAAGYVFECEELTTGQVSLTIHDSKNEQDVGIVICKNGPDVPTAVDKLIQQFDLELNT